MDEKRIGIKEKYSVELNEIKYELQLLKDGRVYEISKTKSDGFLITRATKLEEKINDLLIKIEYNKDSSVEELAKLMKN